MYFYPKDRYAVAGMRAIGNVSNFLNRVLVRQNIPLKLILINNKIQ